ncbi:uncharacterized protein LOC120716337 isoform X2 [Simochromis diagramma]|uniref:uncharacterized protein LOC120716337 isoform X2 n=1 Tax=Simochromis diagramma TaxID=43689 RepID=UPI001A7F07F9|nr:uncharacterized protein LOC120716337 isoform X2 [Simochromis diagramma]
MSANRLPIPEPSVFSGDPLKFKHWKASFQTLIERKNIPTAKKIFFLQKYVGGCVKEALDGYFLIGSEDSYEAAWNMLNERYGEPFVIAKAFRDKLHTWPKVTGKDSAELRKFVDFLQSCQSAMTNNENLNILNDGIENQRLAAKLPDWLSNRWNRKATEYQLEHKRFPRFSYFVTFLSMEASIACNPITSYQAIRQSDFDQPKTKPQPTPIPKRQDTVKIFPTNSTERSMVSCVFCKRAGHGLHKCRKFTEKPVAERVKFIQGEKLCFGCLNSGHLSKNCSNKMTCNTCSKRHPTCLHEERQRQETKKEPPKEQQVSELKETQHQVTQSQDIVNETTSNRVTHESKNTQTSAIVPVYISTQNEPSKEVLIYALLDTQSDSSFILNEVANNLDTTKTQVKLNLSTMSSKKTTVPCTKLKALQIRGLFSKKKLTVPVVYTRDFIPANRSHIPTPDTARAWSHLEHLTEHIAPPLDCEIGLLLGYNCTQALMPREVVCGEENQPYAQRTDLGWSIISYCDSCDTGNDVIGVSHCIIVKQVIPETESPTKLKNKVHYICKTQVKEVTFPDVIKALESDFTESAVEETSISQEDVRFITKLQEGIKQKLDGHYEMPLPFKSNRPDLPNNMPSAMQRLSSLERRFKRDQRYYADHASRGLSVQQLLNSNWFKGPEVLWQSELPVENGKFTEVKPNDPELKTIHVFNTKVEERRTILDRLTKFSDWRRAVKAIACLQKFVKDFKGLTQTKGENTSVEDRQRAELFIIKLAQENTFSKEIKDLTRGKDIQLKDKTHKLYSLSPFVDEQGVLRVGGRLTRATLHPYIKHPAIIPKSSHVSSLLIKHYHEKLRSNGLWITGCSNAVASHIYKCTTCRKYRRHTQDQRMSDLPEDRMEATPPFSYCGIDCFGPFYVKEGRKELKRYGLLFTCMCSRAIHIEMLDDLTSDAFMNALRCFISICGHVRQIRCDQGTNFVGAKGEFLNALKDFDKEQLKQYGCEFVLNTPSSSHMGGVWERQIRTIRSVLTSIWDHTSKRLDNSSLRIFLYEVMAIVNSRPLTVENLNDPNLEPLTPNHILMMKSSVILPPPGEFVS